MGGAGSGGAGIRRGVGGVGGRGPVLRNLGVTLMSTEMAHTVTGTHTTTDLELDMAMLGGTLAIAAVAFILAIGFVCFVACTTKLDPEDGDRENAIAHASSMALSKPVEKFIDKKTKEEIEEGG